MARFVGTVVDHRFHTFEFEADNFDLAKDHLDRLISDAAYADWEIVYAQAEIVGLNQESGF